ncbi:DUF202 domain-containing protein [Gordonia sp. ABSL1-1]|uniref:YidH family protein n=1 Tax=Gordonia sp. ABSL1-1 TaxID=3053923 RepID=UPI002572AEF3|nr:DUF202 domain-containing protein [Gordonia sp. ABSL1-1]MDL9938407.1 DUF202 domain-containing protein [Gordonia sp. ABSL1-1]
MRSERARLLTTDRTSGQADRPRTNDTPEPIPGAVDARFTLAAERTMLAWIRTSLGFLAGGVAIVYIAPDVTSSLIETSLGLVMVALGCAVAITGAVRWRRTLAALERGGPIPGPSQVMYLVAAIVVVAVAVAVAIVVQV